MGGLRKFFVFFLSGLLAVEPVLASSQGFCVSKFAEVFGGNGRLRMALATTDRTASRYDGPSAKIFQEVSDVVANTLTEGTTFETGGIQVTIRTVKGRLEIKLDEIFDATQTVSLKDTERQVRVMEIVLEGIFHGLVKRLRANPTGFQHVDIRTSFINDPAKQRFLDQYGFRRHWLSAIGRYFSPLIPPAIIAGVTAGIAYFTGGDGRAIGGGILLGLVSLLSSVQIGVSNFRQVRTYSLSLDVIPIQGPIPETP